MLLRFVRQRLLQRRTAQSLKRARPPIYACGQPVVARYWRWHVAPQRLDLLPDGAFDLSVEQQP